MYSVCSEKTPTRTIEKDFKTVGMWVSWTIFDAVKLVPETFDSGIYALR